jgi:hypothetical protein
MMALDAPPPVVEDRLLGQWTGDSAALRLGADMRYVYSARPARAPRPAAVAGHGGGWQVQGGTVILRPDSRGVEPITVRIREIDGTIVLETPDGRLAREAPAAEGG